MSDSLLACATLLIAELAASALPPTLVPYTKSEPAAIVSSMGPAGALQALFARGGAAPGRREVVTFALAMSVVAFLLVPAAVLSPMLSMCARKLTWRWRVGWRSLPVRRRILTCRCSYLPKSLTAVLQLLSPWWWDEERRRVAAQRRLRDAEANGRGAAPKANLRGAGTLQVVAAVTSQSQLNAMVNGPTLHLESRYAALLRVLVLVACASAQVPLVIPLASLSFAISYGVEKYMLLREYSTYAPVPLSAKEAAERARTHAVGNTGSQRVHAVDTFGTSIPQLAGWLLMPLPLFHLVLSAWFFSDKEMFPANEVGLKVSTPASGSSPQSGVAGAASAGLDKLAALQQAGVQNGSQVDATYVIQCACFF